MIISECVKINIINSNIKKYKELGYHCSVGCIIEIKINDLSLGSNVAIMVKCDYCNKEREIIYKQYNKSISTNGKFSCSLKCSRLKTKETNLVRYGVEHASQSDFFKNKVKNTNLEKYGVENPFQSETIKTMIKESCLERYGVKHNMSREDVKNKFKETNLERYGFDNYTKTDEYKEKVKETNLQKYGVEYSLQSDIVKEKSKNTNLERYGVDSYTKTDECKDKIKNTSLERYGVEHYSKTNEYKRRVKETNLERYGVEYSSQSKEVKDKIKETNLDRYGFINPFQFEKTKYKIKETNIDRYGVSYYTKSEEHHSSTIIGNDRNYIKYLDNGISLFQCDSGHVFEIDKDNYHNRITKNIPLCTVCNPISDSKSIKEKMLFEYIKSIYSGEIIQSYRDKLEIDIYLHEIKIGFEFNGLYWHSDKYKEKNYHLDKTNYFKERGIRIIHIWEDDWTFKQDIVKSQINNLLKLNTQKIFARKCIIKGVNTKIARQFLDENHIQGFVSSKFKIGLYYTVTQSNGVTNNELVSIMTFDSFEGRKKMEDGGYNLSRFCNKTGYNVVGGASKLLNYFIKINDVKRIVSYADKDWSIGSLYYTLGFENISEGKPDYKYIVDNKRVHKSNYKKSNLKTNLTESQATKNLGLARIYDCGKIKFEYKKREA